MQEEADETCKQSGGRLSSPMLLRKVLRNASLEDVQYRRTVMVQYSSFLLLDTYKKFGLIHYYYVDASTFDALTFRVLFLPPQVSFWSPICPSLAQSHPYCSVVTGLGGGQGGGCSEADCQDAHASVCVYRMTGREANGGGVMKGQRKDKK